MITNELIESIPATYYTDVVDIVFLTTLIIIFDIISRMFCEVLRYNNDAGIDNTILNIILTFFWRAWGRLNDKRYLLSDKFSKGISYKVFALYTPILLFSWIIYLLPDSISLVGVRVDKFVSDIMLMTPIIIEGFSIIENLNDISQTNKKYVEKIAAFIKLIVDKR